MKDREIRVISVADVYSWDANDYSDAFVEEAEWVDTGEPLTDEELNKLLDNYDLHYDLVSQFLLEG